MGVSVVAIPYLRGRGKQRATQSTLETLSTQGH